MARWIKFVLAAVVAMTCSFAATTDVHAATQMYDAPSTTRVEIRKCEADVSNPAQFIRAREVSACPAAVRGTSTTSSALIHATEAGSIRKVNPSGSGTNCVNCAIASDEMLAGNPNAVAAASAPRRISVLESHFGGTFGPATSSAAIEAELLAAGNGARGIVFGSRATGQVGHVFNVVNQNSVVRFLDGQTGGTAVERRADCQSNMRRWLGCSGCSEES